MLLQCCSPDTGVLPIVQPKLCQVTLRSNHINTSPDRNLQKHFDSGLGFKRGNIEGAILVLSFGRAIQKKSICLNLSISLVQCKMQTVLFYKKLEWTQNSKRFLFCRHYNDWKFFTVIIVGRVVNISSSVPFWSAHCTLHIAHCNRLSWTLKLSLYYLNHAAHMCLHQHLNLNLKIAHLLTRLSVCRWWKSQSTLVTL